MMQYRILRSDGDNYITESISDVIEYCISDSYHDEDDDQFEDWVNDNYCGTTIAGVDYSAYDILDRFDNLSDVVSQYVDSANDSDIENAEYELRHAVDGETIYIQNYEVVCEEIDDEPDEEVCDTDLNILREMIETEQMTIETGKMCDECERENYLKLFQTIG